MERPIFPFLWMRGEEEAILRREIEKIAACGIRAVCVEARPHDDFCGPGWWHDMDIVLDEARRRQMACGTEDFLLDRNLAFRDELLKYKVPHEFVTGPGGHEWTFWDTYIQKALDWLPLEEKSAGRSSGNVALE